MQSQFEKILNLVRRTGDKMVVVDKHNPETGYVVMDIKEYKKLIEDQKPWLDEDFCEPWDQPWSEDDEDDFNYEDDDEEDFEYGEDGEMLESELNNEYEENGPEKNIPFPENDYNFSEKNEDQEKLDNNQEYGSIEYTEKEGKNTRKSSRWSIAEEIKNIGEDTSPNSPFPGDEDDDRYYLETI